jgi:anaerobic selenocysteine-containing dehydrogenase
LNHTVKTICRMCSTACGIIAHVKDGKVVLVEGNPDFPINKGGICPKGLSSIQFLYDPKRLRYPLKRVGARGEGKWKQISWDEALKATAAELNEIKRRDGAKFVAFSKGMGGGWDVWQDLWVRLGISFGSPNIPLLSNVCSFPKGTAYITYGGHAEADFENNDGIMVLWGCNPTNTSLPALGRKILDARERGAQLVVIDPVFTPLAAKAHLYIRLRPGTDLALALGMLNVIIAEELYDKDFVEKWTVGFDKLADHVRAYPPERVSRITGVSAATVQDVARRYSTIKPALISIGNAIEQSTNSVQTVRGLSILQAIASTLNVPGGNVADPEPPQGKKLNPTMMLGHMPNYAEESVSRYPLLAQYSTCSKSEVVEAILTGKPYPINGMLVFANEFVTTIAQSKRAVEALKKLEFLAVHDMYLTPTAELADIVFPCTTFLENDDYFYWRGGSARHAIPQNMHIHMWQQKVVDALGECRPNWDFVSGVARALGLGEFFPWDSFEEYVTWELKATGKDFTIDQIKQSRDGFSKVYPLQEVYKKHEKKGFKTPSGKVELYSSILEKFGYDPLPVYVEPAESPVSKPELSADYPLICNNGMKPVFHTHSQFHDLPWLKEMFPEPFAAMNPSTASEYQINDGNRTVVESPRGSVILKAKITKAIPPNTVFIPTGWRQINDLTDDKETDPIIGTFCTRAFLCRIRKV